MKYASIFLKFFSLGLMIATGALWTGAEVNSRPKFRDEQTLIGGVFWTQTIIPIGLIISAIIGEELNVFVHAYFLLAGIILLVITALFLLTEEYRSMKRQPIPTQSKHISEVPTYDKIYFGIGLLSILAAIITLADLFVIVFGN